jgi:hypothetical protein
MDFLDNMEGIINVLAILCGREEHIYVIESLILIFITVTEMFWCDYKFLFIV